MHRRYFLRASAGAAGGLMLALQHAPWALAESEVTAGMSGSVGAERDTEGTDSSVFNAYLEIARDGTIFITCPQAEMGQGVHDGLSKILADELGADWRQVQIRLAMADDAFINPISRRHRTASSESIKIYYDLLRRLGAGAREMLIGAAAERWGVAPAACRSLESQILHMSTDRRLSFAELAAEAATRPVPESPRLKDPKEFTLIGRSLPRKDTALKVDGRAVFGIDVQLPGMLHAAVRRAPQVDARRLGFSPQSALAMPGVVDVFAVQDGVAVLAKNSWQARRAADALEVQFDASAVRGLDTESMRTRMQSALDDDASAQPARPPMNGRFDRERTVSAIEQADRQFVWQYEVPFLAHAALEPLCATAMVLEDEVHVWAPTQQPDRARDAIAAVTGRPRDQVRLHVTFLGGGFGRKWENDFVRQAAEIAKARPGVPIKLTWSREDDTRHDRFRPAHTVRTRVGVDREGRILGMHTRTTGISMWRYQRRRPIPGRADPFVVGMLINDMYAFDNQYVDYVETPEPIPVGTWRSVSQSQNGFFSESAIDDVAYATNQDPLGLRLQLAAGDPRAVRVLRKVADAVNWAQPLPKGRGRGIALSLGYDSYCAEVIEVSVDEAKRVKIDRIVAAFDCGQMIDPHNVEAQVSGGIIWGLSAAINGQIRFADGAAIESNFHDAPILRLNEIPPIEVMLIDSDAPHGGAGEASVPGVAPALASAIQAACGDRPRRLPLIEAGFTLL